MPSRWGGDTIPAVSAGGAPVSFPTPGVRTAAGGYAAGGYAAGGYAAGGYAAGGYAAGGYAAGGYAAGGYRAQPQRGTTLTSPGVRSGGQSTADGAGANNGAAIAAQNAIMHAKSAAVTAGIGKAAQAAAAVAGVYIVTIAGGKTYVGQSKNIDRRLNQHVKNGKFSRQDANNAQKLPVRGNKTAREIQEQIEILKKGGKKALENVVNPLGPARKNLLPPKWEKIWDLLN